MVDFGRVATRNLILGAQNTSSQTALALSAAMVFNTSGPCVAYRFVATRTADLTDVYVYLTSTTGTPSAIRCEVRGYSTASKPAGSVLGQSDINAGGGGTPRWFRAAFGLPVALTEGETYYIVIHNVTGTPASNNASIAYLGPVVNGENLTAVHRPLNSSNGFSSATSNANGGIMVIKLSDGTLIGQAYTQAASDASNALERGILIPALGESLELGGLAWPAAAGITSVHLRRAEKAPGASATTDDELDQTLTTAASDLGEVRWNPKRLRRGQAYRVTLRPAGLLTAPGYYEIQDAARYADVDACVIGGGSFAHCIDNGAGGWTDTFTRWPRMQLLLTGVPSRAFRGGWQ